jgi:Tol biopolymer transport system component
MRRTEFTFAVLALVSLSLVAACNDSAGPSARPKPPATGTIELTTATTGPDPDPDGYTVRLESGVSDTSALVPASGTVSVAVAAGQYSLLLQGVALNCAVVGEHGLRPSEVSVSAGATVALSLAVTCASAPPSLLAFVRDGRIYRVNADGTGLVRLTNGPNDGDPAWSPDGRRIAFTRGRTARPNGELRGWDIHVMDADGLNVVRRTSTEFLLNSSPTWSPDGRSIAFSGSPIAGGATDVYVISADDDGADPRNVTTEGSWDGEPAWSPDGASIAFSSSRPPTSELTDIFVTSPDGPPATRLTQAGADGSRVNYSGPAWSPDGRKLAVSTCLFDDGDRCDPATISVMSADGSGLTVLVPTEGWGPTWSPDGRTIAFVSAGSIGWVTVDGGERGVIVADGYSPAWRP